jgi:hypothetical protein
VEATLRIAQADILDFGVNPKYCDDMKWQDDYLAARSVARECLGGRGRRNRLRGHPTEIERRCSGSAVNSRISFSSRK